MYRRMLSVIHFSKWRFVAIDGFVGLVMLAQLSRVEFDRYATHSPRFIPVKNQVQQAFDCYKNMLDINRKHGNTWDDADLASLTEIVEKCAGPLQPLLNLQEFKSNTTEDIKFIVPGTSSKFIYTMMTIGIDNNTESEQAIMEMYPNFDRFVGVDATPEVNQDLVKGIGGKFLNYQIVGNQTIMPNHSTNTTFNGTVSVPSVDLTHVFKAAEMEHNITVLNLNINNDEQVLFGELISKSQEYPTICQLNIKFNHPDVHNDGSIILGLLYRASSFGRYLLIKSTSTANFKRFFFLNVRDAYCIEKYAKILFN
uniref:Methyltransf_21 domain-containing protein n=1 Tax=Panagrellus redivivus TaxID=6233 RepID=A0A7E4VMX9_PANRE